MDKSSNSALKTKQYFGGVILSGAVICYVLIKLDWQVTYFIFTQLNWGWLVIAFGVYLVNYALRTLRFKILLNLNHLPFRHLFGITNLYGMYLYLMPAKTGELSYPILLKNRLKVSLSEGSATLIAARFFDFATISLLLPFVLGVFWNQLDLWIKYSALAFIGFVFIIGLVLIGAARSKPLREKIFSNRVFRMGWLTRLSPFLDNLFSNLKAIDEQGNYRHLWALTFGIWVCVQTNFYIILLSLGYHFTYFQMVVISIIMVPMTLLPLQGFANLGTHEIGWSVAFSLFGFTQATALSIAINTHIILLFFILLLGLVGYLLQKKY